MDPFRYFVILFALIDITKRSRGLSRMSVENKKAYGRYLKEKLENLGPTFVKFGQMLSVRFDLLPSEVCLELQELLNKEKPFPTAIAKQMIEAESGIPINQLFTEFDETPVATASIGQVYRARLYTGEEVAVKIQRPEAQKSIHRDLKIFGSIMNMSRVFKFSRLMRLNEIYTEFRQWTAKEVDYLQELSNIETFAFKFKDFTKLKVPKVYRKYCTSRLLIMEYVHGRTLDEVIKEVNDTGKKEITVGEKVWGTTELAQELADILSKQILEIGYFHADPHPANVMILNNGSICLIDFGIIGSVDKALVKNIRDTLIAISSGETEKIIEIAIKIDEHPGDEKTDKLRNELTRFVLSYSGATASETSFTQFITNLLYMGGRNGIQWPLGLVLFAKQFITLDGIVYKLAPEMNVVEHFTPYARRLAMEDIAERFSDSNLYKNLYKVADTFTKFPDVMVRMLDTAQRYMEKNMDNENIVSDTIRGTGRSGTASIPMLGMTFTFILFLALLLGTNRLLDQVSLTFLWVLVIMLGATTAFLIVKKE